MKSMDYVPRNMMKSFESNSLFLFHHCIMDFYLTGLQMPNHSFFFFWVHNRYFCSEPCFIVHSITYNLILFIFSCRIIENDLFKQDWRARTKVEICQYVVLKWTLALLIGLSTGVVGFFNNLAVENIAGFKLLLTNNLMLKEKYV